MIVLKYTLPKIPRDIIPCPTSRRGEMNMVEDHAPSTTECISNFTHDLSSKRTDFVHSKVLRWREVKRKSRSLNYICNNDLSEMVQL